MKNFKILILVVLLLIGCTSLKEATFTIFDVPSGVLLATLYHEEQHSPLDYIDILNDFFQEYNLDNKVSLRKRKSEEGEGYTTVGYVYKNPLSLEYNKILIKYLKEVKGFYEKI